jgi:uncharacterized protein YecE (DUF72 family)
MPASSNIHIGTSGWQYGHWRGLFYPKEIRRKEYLNYYAQLLHTVEINNSFYRLPERETLAEWRDAVPPGFIFTVKATRFITHRKKLKDPERSLLLFLETISSLNNKLGPILFQLPPGWNFNAERFYDFLESLPSGYRFAFEFRDPSWHNSLVYDALTEMGAAFCSFEVAGVVSPKVITTDFIYIRLLGPVGAYKGQYTNTILSGWAGAISSWVNQGREVFCYFENDEGGYAVEDALKLQDMLESG